MRSISIFCTKLCFCCFHQENQKEDDFNLNFTDKIETSYIPTQMPTNTVQRKTAEGLNKVIIKRQENQDFLGIEKNIDQNGLDGKNQHEENKINANFFFDDEKRISGRRIENNENFLNPNKKKNQDNLEKDRGDINNRSLNKNKQTAKISPSKYDSDDTLVEVDFFNSPFTTDEEKRALRVYMDSNKSIREILDKKKKEKYEKEISISDNIIMRKIGLAKLNDTKVNLEINYKKSQVRDVLEKVYSEDEKLKLAEEKFNLAIGEKDDCSRQFIKIFNSHSGKISKDNQYMTRKIAELNCL